jgi:hypothetical protein
MIVSDLFRCIAALATLKTASDMAFCATVFSRAK